MRKLTLIILLLATSAGAQVPLARADTAALQRTLRAIAGAHHGLLRYSVRNLDTGQSI
jgi:hypothetical protein